MSRKQSGFTLIELMIVIAIIAIIAAIAIPNLLAARLAANETAAIATLRNLVSAQAQFQQSGKLDTEVNLNGTVGDGTGEYGGFLDMAGSNQGTLFAETGAVLNPPVLSGAFQTVDIAGRVTRSGYLFAMFLPDGGGLGVSPDAGNAVVHDADNAETTWCAYAWPVNYNTSGNRTFFVNQQGDVLASEDTAAPFDGTTTVPASDAAFDPADATAGIMARTAVNMDGNAGGVWRQTN